MEDQLEIKTNNMMFKGLDIRRSGTLVLAFIKVEDLGSSGEGFMPPQHKHYWGQVSSDNPSQEEIRQIMKKGGKWEGFNGKGRIIL